jgi:hypothetical protein
MHVAHDLNGKPAIPKRRLAREGLTARHLREAARIEAELEHSSLPARKSARPFELAGHRRSRL